MDISWILVPGVAFALATAINESLATEGKSKIIYPLIAVVLAGIVCGLLYHLGREKEEDMSGLSMPMASLFYFAPSLIAFGNKEHSRWLYFFLNLFFGWTIIVWFLLFAFAAWPRAKERKKTHPSDSDNIS
jgi:hypothetical protein